MSGAPPCALSSTDASSRVRTALYRAARAPTRRAVHTLIKDDRRACVEVPLAEMDVEIGGNLHWNGCEHAPPLSVCRRLDPWGNNVHQHSSVFTGYDHRTHPIRPCL